MVKLNYSYRNVRLFIKTGESNHQDGYIQLKNNVIYILIFKEFKPKFQVFIMVLNMSENIEKEIQEIISSYFDSVEIVERDNNSIKFITFTIETTLSELNEVVYKIETSFRVTVSNVRIEADVFPYGIKIIFDIKTIKEY